jgi:hypothetical protein
MLPPTLTTNSIIQTIQQNVGFNQILGIQPSGGKIMLSGEITAESSQNVVGNIVGSGTALTNLNYNAITNKPDLTVYTPKETSERQHPPKIWDTAEKIASITYNPLVCLNLQIIIK